MRVPLVPGAPEKDAARSGLLRSEFSPYRAIIDGICTVNLLPKACHGASVFKLIWPL